MNVVDNPWDIKGGANGYVARGDEGLIKSISSRCKRQLHLDLWHEPYIGNPNAPVYVLGANPGYNWKEEVFKDSNEWKNLMKSNLLHKGQPGLYDFVYFNVVHYKNVLHPGCLWWWQKTRSLTEELNKGRSEKERLVQILYPNIFSIEYFPYHSVIYPKGIDEKILKESASYKYANYLLAQALQDNKIIVIMRKTDEWIARIKEILHECFPSENIEDYYNRILMLKNPQNVCISQGNVEYCDEARKNMAGTNNIPTAWDLLVNELRG